MSKVASPMPWSFERDLDDVLEHCLDIWPKLAGAHIFMTGGTGLIGRWLLETLRRANEVMSLGVQVTVLSRDPDAYARKAPHLAAYDAYRFVRGDVLDFKIEPQRFSHLIHAATDASAHLNETDPRRMFDTVVAGTRHVLDFAVEAEIGRVFFLSSGAVYGQQPWDMERVSESWLGGPSCTDPRATYAEGKRAAEMLCAIYAKQFGLDIVTSRIFALLGPHLALDIHFAAGNFIRDAIAGRPIVIRSTGQACRSYIYLSDLTAWLWRQLAVGAPGSIYNMGSEEWVSLRDLARITSEVVGKGEYQILGLADAGWNPGRYVPDTSLVQRELGVRLTVPLEEAIRRTALWNGWGG